ncbi:efflux RND transporter periplasmic adaptor subunit [Mesoterricola sediminis]|uniref:RND transporter n=1 Tax=Mesoterricola sediminis TaxID=2927980 RepID=A0AA48GRI0_9BACT|nr:efflux RND transporter periplasmic adaptor subunit [Mesoterricola sediminis]BDU77921.1 RND transporter [Mesoterricola sediminis]
MRRSLLVALPTAAVLAGCAALAAFRPKPAPAWRFVPIERGEVVRKVTATGTVNALISVSVGTQVSGSVTDLKADFNSVVRKGQVIARIDPTVNETQVADARAALRKAQASCDLAREERDRYRRMAAQQLVSKADLQAKETAFETASGDLEAARSALQRARINLAYCTITAPVDGVVVSRVVDVGQTVAASFSTPSLFVIAKDLSRMKVSASIDESDIGQIRPGQQATFTVDSYQGMTFRGVVSEVQLNPTVSNNVVTYTVVMEVDNVPRPAGSAPVAKVAGTSRYREPGAAIYQGELALFPGMTANVAILTTERKGVLRVPNAALRYNPGTTGAKPEGGARVWVLENGAPRPVPVVLGAAGQQYTEISGEGIREGLQVLAGSDQAQAAAPAQQKATLGGPPGPPR